MNTEIITASFGHNGLVLYMEQEHEDFWLDMGICWGFFKNLNKCENFTNEDVIQTPYGFWLQEIKLKDDETPSPILNDFPVLYDIDCLTPEKAPLWWSQLKKKYCPEKN